jgi:hypothetical protein
MARMVRGAVSAAGRVLTHQVSYDPTSDFFYDWIGQTDGAHSAAVDEFDAVMAAHSASIVSKKDDIADRSEAILVEDDKITKLRAAKKDCERERDTLEHLLNVDQMAVEIEQKVARELQIKHRMTTDLVNGYKPWAVSVFLLS